MKRYKNKIIKIKNNIYCYCLRVCVWIFLKSMWRCKTQLAHIYASIGVNTCTMYPCDARSSQVVVQSIIIYRPKSIQPFYCRLLCAAALFSASLLHFSIFITLFHCTPIYLSTLRLGSQFIVYMSKRVSWCVLWFGFFFLIFGTWCIPMLSIHTAHMPIVWIEVRKTIKSASNHISPTIANVKPIAQVIYFEMLNFNGFWSDTKIIILIYFYNIFFVFFFDFIDFQVNPLFFGTES